MYIFSMKCKINIFDLVNDDRYSLPLKTGEQRCRKRLNMVTMVCTMYLHFNLNHSLLWIFAAGLVISKRS